MRQRYFTLGLLALAIGVLIFPACEKEEAVKALPPPDVLVQDAATRDVPVYREWIGTLDGSENAEIRARVTGYLLKRDYQEGALVKKADVLFEIDPRPFEAALAEAKSQLGQAQAVQLASSAERERSQELFDKRVISEKEHTNKIQLDDSNLAKVEALKANVDQAQLNLNFCKVTSPVEGIAGISRQGGRSRRNSEQHGAHFGFDPRSYQDRLPGQRSGISRGSEPHPGGYRRYPWKNGRSSLTSSSRMARPFPTRPGCFR